MPPKPQSMTEYLELSTKEKMELQPKYPWAYETRRESGLVELVCKCGVGHPAPGSVHWMALHGKDAMDVHGCCGCCRTTEWRLAAATRGYEIANEALKKTMATLKAALATIDQKNEEIQELKYELAESDSHS